MEIKVKKVCDWINLYRDGELDEIRKAEFERHMTRCLDCRRTIALLNNLVHILKPAPLVPPSFPERVARLAFARARTWDFMVISWLRPTPAWIVLVFCLLLTSLVLLSPQTTVPADVYGEYETLSGDTGPRTQAQPVDFSTWWEQGGGR